MNRRIIGIIIILIITISIVILYVSRDTKEKLAKDIILKNEIAYTLTLVVAKELTAFNSNNFEKIGELLQSEENIKSFTKPIINFTINNFTYDELKKMKKMSTEEVMVMFFVNKSSIFKYRYKEWRDYLIQENEYKINKILEY